MTSYLVTGGTGTFARAFIRTVLPTASRIVAFARHEKEMADLEHELGNPPNARFYLGDVRDPDRLEFAMHGVDTVIHAAALKRIEQCERDPIEAVLTNIVGTKNVIYAALRAGVSQCVLLSTDKAVDPINLYGATKLTAERLFVAANNIAGGRCKFSVARYGNIWGSRGSVVHQWRDRMALSLPIRLSHPDATRYFMRTGEAVELVLGLLNNEGVAADKIRTPRLPAYRLGDLADAIEPKAVEVTGLAPWEKLHETMDGITDSSQARRMTMAELAQAIAELP